MDTLPLPPLASASTVRINGRYSIEVTGDLRVVLFDKQPVMEFHENDTAGRDLVAVHLSEHGRVSEEAIARAFEISRSTISRAKRRYGQGGAPALVPKKRGPKGPTKIKAEKEKLIVLLARQNRPKTEIGARIGVNESAVRKALRRLGLEELAVRQAVLGLDEPVAQSEENPQDGAVAASVSSAPQSVAAEQCAHPGEPHPALSDVELPAESTFDEDPQDRATDRLLAAQGLLHDAAPLFKTQGGVRYAGLLLAVPILVVQGVVADGVRIFGSIGPAFYGIRNTVLSLLLMLIARIPRPENLKEHGPGPLGSVLGLDRAPEMKTVRRKMKVLAALKKSLDFMDALTRRHLSRDEGTRLWAYIDGHVSVYSGKRKLAKQHVTRLRISAPAVLDYWANDARGGPLLAVVGAPRKSMHAVVSSTIEQIRSGGDNRPVTLVFDREGWSPVFFEQLMKRKDVFFLTYRKARAGRQLPRLQAGAFTKYEVGGNGMPEEYELADQGIHIDHGQGRKRHRLRLRQITRRTRTGHQTHIVTNDWQSSTLDLALQMFGRWGQENFFKYMSRELNLDGLVTYRMEDTDSERLVPNPARADALAKIRALERELAEMTEEYGKRALGSEERRQRTMRGFKIANAELRSGIDEHQRTVDHLRMQYAQLPVKVPVREILRGERPQQPDSETRRLFNCFRIAAIRAESALRELIRPCYARWKEDGRTIVQAMLQSSGDLEVRAGELRVTLGEQSAPHRTAALRHLCEELNALHVRFPGSALYLSFAVRDGESVS